MSHAPDLQPDLDLLRHAVRAAGDAVMPYFRSDTEVHFKQADQPVTAADYAADAVLREILTAARPEYGWLSEESAASPDRLARPRVWVVDPIDGTNSFVEGLPEFVVSVGLVENGSPVAAALFNPVTGELYDALRGGGARLGERRLRIAPPPAHGEPPVLLASRGEIGRGEFADYQREWTVRPLGSTAYRMLKVAEGAAHGFFSRSLKAEWDVCAAALVVEESGGTVTDARGAPLRFNRPSPSFQGVVTWGSVPLKLADAEEAAQ